ncbi:MAG: hypothetical protein KDB30_11430 [Tetrasphaera sp.]|nr:hypothetical protein [Tetrasphaera sp.]
MHATRVRPTTYTTDSGAIRKWIVPTLGHRRLADLTPADTRALRKAITAAGRSTTTALTRPQDPHQDAQGRRNRGSQRPATRLPRRQARQGQQRPRRRTRGRPAAHPRRRLTPRRRGPLGRRHLHRGATG